LKKWIHWSYNHANVWQRVLDFFKVCVQYIIKAFFCIEQWQNGRNFNFVILRSTYKIRCYCNRYMYCSIYWPNLILNKLPILVTRFKKHWKCFLFKYVDMFVPLWHSTVVYCTCKWLTFWLLFCNWALNIVLTTRLVCLLYFYRIIKLVHFYLYLL
jgi:hypothetical protein